MFVGNNTWCTQPGKLEPGSELMCWKNNWDYGKNTCTGYIVDSGLQIQICWAQNSSAVIAQLWKWTAYGILTTCTSICKYKLTTAASVLQSLLNYNWFSFFIFLYTTYIQITLKEYFLLQFSFAYHFNFVNSLSKRSASGMRKPRKRWAAKGSVRFIAHGSIIFWKISHSSLNSFSINFNLTTAKL